MIAGPCSIESREQLISAAHEAQKRNISILRACVSKPRTEPGFEGCGDQAIPWLVEVAQMGLMPASEVLLPVQAEKIMNAILGKVHNAKIMFWIGSRNQNHLLQRDIGKAIAGESRVSLMIKNQMWPDAKHWIGIVKHVLEGGASLDQLLLCHRGFAPSTTFYRNPPKISLAFEVQHALYKEYGVELPLLADPSHIAGFSANNVISMAKKLLDFEWKPPEDEIIPFFRIRNNHSETKSLQKFITSNSASRVKKFNGLITEVHSNPQAAMTDVSQQLTWEEYDEILKHPEHSRE